jgi:acetyl esterase
MRLSIPTVLSACVVGLGLTRAAWAQTPTPPPDAPPAIRTYKTVGGVDLAVHVFGPPTRDLKPRPTIVLLHGGGWNVGSPEWTYSQARRYAAKGLTAIAIQYRLSDFQAITPLDAMADTRDAMRWIRTHARELRVDPRKIAIYGWSAGGHLGVSATLFDDAPKGSVSGAPDALVLMSPAVSVTSSGYLRSLLLGRAENTTISPADHVRAGMPPMIIFSGDQDVVTPNGAAGRFCTAVKTAGNRCELHVYPGVGHLLTRKLDREAQEMGPFDPDPATIADTRRQSRRVPRQPRIHVTLSR